MNKVIKYIILTMVLLLLSSCSVMSDTPTISNGILASSGSPPGSEPMRYNDDTEGTAAISNGHDLENDLTQTGEVSDAVMATPDDNVPEIDSTPTEDVPTKSGYAYYFKNYSLYYRNAKEEILVCDYDYPYLINADSVFYAEEDGIFRMDEYGERVQLFEGKTYALVEDSGWLYFCNDYGVFRMLTDGTNLSNIVEGFIRKFTVVEGYIFYVEHAVPEWWEFYDDGPPIPAGKLVKISADGSNRYEFDTWVTFLDSNNENVYFVDASTSGTSVLFMIEPKTSVVSTIYKSKTYIDQIKLFDDDIFFIEFRSIAKISMTDYAYTILRDNGWNRIVGILNGYIYFCDSLLIDTEIEYYGLAKIKTDGSGFEKIHCDPDGQ